MGRQYEMQWCGFMTAALAAGLKPQDAARRADEAVKQYVARFQPYAAARHTQSVPNG